MEQKHIAALDLGTSKIALAVAEVSGQNVQVIYYSETPSDGIRNSTVFNPQKASVPIRKAIREAEQELMIRIRQVIVGLPRYSVEQEVAKGEFPRTNPNEYISREEIELLKDIALQQYPLDNEETQFIYGAVAQSFSTDTEIQLSEDDVVGTLSSNVAGNFKIFIGQRSSVSAIDKMFNDMGIAIAKKYFLPDVVAKTVLSEEDRQNGVALVDVGAGVTSVAIYHGGIMRYYASIPFGGKAVTNDIRTECSISEDLAEKIKKRFGACQPGKLASLSEKVLQIRLTEPFKEVPVRYISEVVDCRSREIVEAVLYYIQESGLQNTLRSGIVLTGGGAELANFVNLMKEMSGYDVRKGYPRFMFSASVGSGVYSTAATAAIGMVLSAKNDNLPDCVSAPEKVEDTESEVVEVEVTDETPAPEGALFAPEAFGEAVPKEKPKTTKTVKVTKPKSEKTGIFSIFWKNVEDTALKIYDSANKEDEETR
jgi:cell division protein FtsA